MFICMFTLSHLFNAFVTRYKLQLNYLNFSTGGHSLLKYEISIGNLIFHVISKLMHQEPEKNMQNIFVKNCCLPWFLISFENRKVSV